MDKLAAGHSEQSGPRYDPKVFNIEMDPHEDLIVGGLFTGCRNPRSKRSMILETLKKYPNTEHHAVQAE